MNLEVLISCMNQNDVSIVEKSRLTGDVLIVNQCQEEKTMEVWKKQQRIRMISTTERGLSNSRNMAVHASDRDICLLCDDDEMFSSDYEKVILRSFQRLPDADIIAFHVHNKVTRIKRACRVNFLQSLKLASYQLAFRRKAILEHGILFDPIIGAGSGNGCGEENKFLFDCLKKGLKIYFVPVAIAELQDSGSTWFHGYDQTFFYQRGATTRYIMGLLPALAYGGYNLLAKHSLYQNSMTLWGAAGAVFRGIISNPISRQKRMAEADR